MPDDLLTIQEACEALKCGRTTLYLLLAENRLKAVKHGTRTCVIASSVNRYKAVLPAFVSKARVIPPTMQRDRSAKARKAGKASAAATA